MEVTEKQSEYRWTRALLDSLALPTDVKAGDTISPEWLKRAQVHAGPGFPPTPWSGNIYAYNAPTTPTKPPNVFPP